MTSSMSTPVPHIPLTRPLSLSPPSLSFPFGCCSVPFSYPYPFACFLTIGLTPPHTLKICIARCDKHTSPPPPIGIHALVHTLAAPHPTSRPPIKLQYPPAHSDLHPDRFEFARSLHSSVCTRLLFPFFISPVLHSIPRLSLVLPYAQLGILAECVCELRYLPYSRRSLLYSWCA